MALSRSEREEHVLDLYYNQHKNYRQIAEEARICPRDIKTIVDSSILQQILLHI
jgi:DNA-directed RNA polymerase specialized sigma subunit